LGGSAVTFHGGVIRVLQTCRCDPFFSIQKTPSLLQAKIYKPSNKSLP